jgi:hypothetical protein
VDANDYACFSTIQDDEDDKAAAEANEECDNSSEERVGPFKPDGFTSMR